MKYFIKVYGCQMNYSDAERVAALLENLGYQKTANEEEADLAVFLACSVREAAVNRLYGNGKKFKKYRKINPNFKAILTGCVIEGDKTKLEQVFDHILEIKNLCELPEKLGVERKNNFESYFQIKPANESPYTAYVPIMTGCNNFCSYCIVPYTRGREYSRPAQEIIAEITELVQKGYREIILLGQNVNSYKPDEETNFPALLQKINEIKGDFWIRFLTSHPKDMSEELIQTIKKCEKCTNYIHLALQSGNNEILEKMNRRYTKEHFMNLVRMIRANIGEVTLTTDVIVGFPGETEKQFQDTVKTIKEANFDMAYINKYSPRSGTVSFDMPDNVSWEEKKNREKRLNEVLKKTAAENNQKYKSQIVSILLETKNDKYYFGKTRSFKDIKIPKNSKKEFDLGNFYVAKISKVTPWALEGEITE